MKQKRFPFQIYLTPEIKELFIEMAEQRGMPMGPWLVQAGLSYARSAKRSEGKNAEPKLYASGWPRDRKCFHCFKEHDPAEAHATEFPNGIEDFLDLADQPSLKIRGKRNG